MIPQFLFFRFFSSHNARYNNDSLSSAIIYIAMYSLCLVFAITVNLQCLLDFLYNHEVIPTKIPLFQNEIVFYLVYTVALLLYIYFRIFYKKNTDYYVKKYDNHWMNKFFFRALYVLIPLLIFFAGLTVAILLFGGSMFNYETEGILNQLFQ